MGGKPPWLSLEPLGDMAILAQFASEEEAMGFARRVRDRPLGRLGVIDVTAAYRAVSLHLDAPCRDRDAIASLLADVDGSEGVAARFREIPCCYDLGEDLEWVAHKLGLKPEEVVAAHASATFTVYALGFIPGFAYMGWLPANLAGLPRRETPRTAVPEGSVAIAGRQTGVYPVKVPGGWHLIGKTPCRVVRPEAGWFPLQPGDKVRFRPISTCEYSALAGTDLPAVE